MCRALFLTRGDLRVLRIFRPTQKSAQVSDEVVSGWDEGANSITCEDAHELHVNDTCSLLAHGIDRCAAPCNLHTVGDFDGESFWLAFSWDVHTALQRIARQKQQQRR